MFSNKWIGEEEMIHWKYQIDSLVYTCISKSHVRVMKFKDVLNVLLFVTGWFFVPFIIHEKKQDIKWRTAHEITDYHSFNHKLTVVRSTMTTMKYWIAVWS